jgi:hypothetical protein
MRPRRSRLNAAERDVAFRNGVGGDAPLRVLQARRTAAPYLVFPASACGYLWKAGQTQAPSARDDLYASTSAGARATSISVSVIAEEIFPGGFPEVLPLHARPREKSSLFAMRRRAVAGT